LIDLTLGSLALVIFTPFIILISIFIFFKDGGPVIVKQNRVGLHGKIFKMYKFRTMYQHSHDLREDLQELNTKSGPLFKIDNDPRLIPGAVFLRKYSLDELPQIINVLLGRMSLVGPRPLFDSDTKFFDSNYMRRLNVMPGMTGLLQINDRNADDFETWFKYDVEYIENWSLYLDVKIILKTIPSLFRRNIQGK
jgi:lipopolysaccharide/colanic/teichoic acid biosynthesis glycosyltransferase